MRNDNLLAGGRRFREHRPLHGIPRITNQESSRTSEDCVGTPGRSKITELQPKLCTFSTCACHPCAAALERQYVRKLRNCNRKPKNCRKILLLARICSSCLVRFWFFSRRRSAWLRAGAGVVHVIHKKNSMPMGKFFVLREDCIHRIVLEKAMYKN